MNHLHNIVFLVKLIVYILEHQKKNNNSKHPILLSMIVFVKEIGRKMSQQYITEIRYDTLKNA
jgi:hypothetical protein